MNKNSDHLICFDLDGVLISSMAIANQIFYDTVEEQLALSTEEYRKQKRTMALSAEERFDLLWKEEIQEKGITEKQIQEALLEYRRRKMKAPIPLLPRAKETLEMMSEAFEFIALVSNNPDDLLEEMVERFGIAGYFSKITGISHVQFTKPHPQMYQVTAEHFGIPTQKSLVFEDSSHGIAAGKGAGMKVIAVATGLESVEDLQKTPADLVIEDFSQLKPEQVDGLLEIL